MTNEREEELIKKMQYKSIEDWNRKLEHMHTILTATEGICK